MRSAALLFLLAALTCGVVQAQQGAMLKANPSRAETQQGVVILTWETISEVGVIGFEVERSSPSTNDQFRLISGGTPIVAHGPNRPYTFRDTDLYKSAAALAKYKVWAVLGNGTRQELFQVEVNYTTTGIRRTWGSIKAMFQ